MSTPRLAEPRYFILLGVRRLLSDGGLHAPRWYDFTWFGFATDDAEDPALAKRLEPAIEVSLEGL